MKSLIAILVFVALSGQVLSSRVRRQADESDDAGLDPLQVKFRSLNYALLFCLQEIQLKDFLGHDATKLVNRATILCTRIKESGGTLNTDNQRLMTTVYDLFTEEQREKCGL